MSRRPINSGEVWISKQTGREYRVVEKIAIKDPHAQAWIQGVLLQYADEVAGNKMAMGESAFGQQFAIKETIDVE